MRTIPYYDYSERQAFDDALASEGHYHVTGISPFEVPDGVEFELLRDDLLSIAFWYSNDEPSEPRYRRLSRDGSIVGRLGMHTKKILELRVRGASELLEKDRLRLDEQSVSEWLYELPVEAFSSCIKNFHVVQAILQTMPASVREKLITALREMA